MSSLKRRLAAIVFTDIVGFTDLSSKDEEGAYKLVVKQREILKPIVLKHEGQWLKEEGDALLLSFPSTKEAVNCSIQIHPYPPLLHLPDEFRCEGLDYQHLLQLPESG